MRSGIFCGIILGTLTVLSFEYLSAQPWSDWGMHSRHKFMSELKNVIVLEGVVKEVSYHSPLKGMSSGVRLRLKVNKLLHEIHLGPRWYIENQETSIGLGDNIKVEGAKVKLEGRDIIIAMTLTKGQKTLRLRDNHGHPYWAGRRECCRK